jgi:hypothetical protein
MARRVARYLVGSLVVLGLAACGKQWLAERETWRHEAEVACLKSGQVKESALVVRAQPISGPGMCGADFPLKVAAIGEGNPIGYADELRPPGSIPGVVRQPLAYPPPPAPNYAPAPQYQYPQQQAYPQQQYAPPPQQYPQQQQYPAQQYPQQQAYPQQAYPPTQAAPSRPAYAPGANAPMSIYAPGVTPPEPDGVDDEDQPEEPQPYPQRGPAVSRQPYPSEAYPAQPYPAQPAEQVPLGRERAPATTGSVAIQPTATLACPIVSALDTWFASGVQPAAVKWFGVQVAEIKQISAYSCRGMNGQPGARISEHAFGNALDIASFTLADGRRITVKDGWRGMPEEQGFLRDVHASACQHFNTVLAPGSNVYHYDHIHVDLMRRSSRRQVCNPTAVSGELVAARAGYRYGQRGEPGVTGSIKPETAKVARKPSFFQPFGRDEVYDRLPRAVPGED